MGHRRRDGAADGETLVVEPLGDDRTVGDDIELGGGSPRPVIIAAAVAAVVVSVGIAVSLFGRDDTTTAPVAVTTTTAAQTTTSAAARRGVTDPPADGRAITFRVGSGPMIATDQPWQLYLRTASGGALYRIDVTSGWAVPVDDTVGQIYQVLPGVSEPVVVDGRRAAQRPDSWVPGPAGRVWMPGSTGNSVDLIEIGPGGDSLVSTVTIGPQERLIGSTASGDPVISGPNARQYVARAGGERVQLAAGLVPFVDAGSFVELSCDEAQLCSMLAHGAAGGAPLEMPYRPSRAYRFSPGGTHVAALDADGLDVIDLADGSVVASFDAPMFNAQRSETPAEVAWTPDGRYVMAAMADGTLLVVDLTTRSARTHELPERLVLGVPLAVL